MNYLNTLQYDSKRRRILDSTGYTQNESLSYSTELTDPFTIIGANDTKVIVGYGGVNDPLIGTFGLQGDSSIALRGEGTGVVELVDQKVNYLKTTGTTTGQMIVNATSDTNANVSLALQSKGGAGIIQIGDPTIAHLELTNDSIISMAPTPNTDLKLYAMGAGGTHTFKSTNNDSFVITPGSGSTTIAVTSSNTDANLEINPNKLGNVRMGNRFQTSGDMPNVVTTSDASILIENTNSGQTSSLMVSANNNVPYLSWDVSGVNGRSLGLGTNGEIYLQDQWRIDVGSTLFRINTDGQISQTTLRPTFQSGSYTTGSTGWERITFARAFPSTPAVVGIVKHTTASRVRICGIKNVGSTGFDVKAWTTNTDGVSAWVGSITTVYWFAAVPTQ